MNEITIPYEEYMELIRLKVRVEVLADLIERYKNVTIKEAIAILNLEADYDKNI